MKVCKVTVIFDDEVLAAAQGPALLHFEQELRQSTGLDIRVFKQKMGDDSKLRIMMTQQQRDNL